VVIDPAPKPIYFSRNIIVPENVQKSQRLNIDWHKDGSDY